MCRYCYLLFLLLLTVVRVNNGYCDEKERTLTVAATVVAGPGHEAEAKEFARRISFRSGLTAHVVAESSWYKAPLGVEAGYQPTLAQHVDRLSFAFRKRADGFDVCATLTQAGKTVTRDHHGMCLENIYDELGLLCRQLGAWNPTIKAFGRLYPHAVLPLAAITRERDMGMEDVLICQADGYLLALGNRSIEPLWQIPAGGAEAKTKMNFAMQAGTNSSLIGFSRASIIRIDVSNGGQSLLAKPGTDDRLSWAADGSECAVRRETYLYFYQDGKEKWSVDCGEPLSGSPALNRDAVFISTTLGRLICFGREDGKQRWEIPLGSACKGRLTLIKEYVYAADTTGTLHCIAVNDGKIRWSISVGDFLLQPPVLVAGSLLAVTRQNRIFVVNPATGEVMHSRQWPTWLRSVTPLMLENKPHLFSIDIRHQLHVLAWPTLETQAEMAFPFQLESPPLALHDFGTSWHGSDNFERLPTVLLTDKKGHIFLLDPMASAERGQL